MDVLCREVGKEGKQVGEVRVLLWKHSFGAGVGEMGKARPWLLAFTASFPLRFSFPKGIHPVN